MERVRFYLRLAQRHLPWVASLVKLIYYVLKLAGEVANYLAVSLRSQFFTTKRQEDLCADERVAPDW